MSRSPGCGWLTGSTPMSSRHADKETLRNKWMKSDDRWAARAGWQLTAGRVAKSPEGLDLEALSIIEKEMAAAAPEVRGR